METAAALRLSNSGSISHVCPALEKSGLTAWPTLIRSHAQSLTVGKLSSSVRQARTMVSCVKTPESTVASKVVLNDIPNGSAKKHALQSASFPSVFEALITEVCDETSVAELHLKVGNFEMLLKRNVGATSAPTPFPPPIPTDPIVQTAPAAASISAVHASSQKADAFTSASSLVSSKLASLEASGIAGYKLVTSPRVNVGSLRRGRTVKGKKQPPICKQGDVIKEGQVIGYIEQFGTELPVKSEVAGEILKVLVDEGEAVGYCDPLMAILPSLS